MGVAKGWVARGWEPVLGAFEHNFERGAEVGAAFCACHRGEVVVDLWGGSADPGAGTQWEEDTLVLVYSTTKGVTAMCANRLADEGALEVDAPVSEYWPEFARDGKDGITVADLLAHRAGLAWTDEEMSQQEVFSWDPVIRSLERESPSWTPGTAHGYHATTFGWLVGEVIRRVTGKSVGSYLHDEITAPLDADFFIGLPATEERRVARLVPFSLKDLSAGREAVDVSELQADIPDAEARIDRLMRDAAAFDRQQGLMSLASEFFGRDSALVKALLAPGRVFRDEGLWQTPELHAAEIPAANGICDARSLARLYSACIGDVASSSGESFRVLSRKQLDRALRQETHGPDRVLLNLDIQWGLGFMLNRGLIDNGSMGGARAFGHFGMGGSAGWADPDAELAMGYVMNKMSMGTTGDPRAFNLIRTCFDVAKGI